MDNFTPEQFERYEAYRRSALPKQSVRKVFLDNLPISLLVRLIYLQTIQQSTNFTVSQPVAQVVAGFAKVFVGEMVERGRLCISTVSSTNVEKLPVTKPVRCRPA